MGPHLGSSPGSSLPFAFGARDRKLAVQATEENHSSPEEDGERGACVHHPYKSE